MSVLINVVVAVLNFLLYLQYDSVVALFCSGLSLGVAFVFTLLWWGDR